MPKYPALKLYGLGFDDSNPTIKKGGQMSDVPLIDVLALTLRDVRVALGPTLGEVRGGPASDIRETIDRVLERYHKWKSGVVEMPAPSKPPKKLEPADNRCPHCGTWNPPFGTAMLQIVETGALIAIFACGVDSCRSIIGVQMVRMPTGTVELANQMPGGKLRA
jgi:hypothetical protein